MGDWGEDTISLHVSNNDSYLCADVTLTSDNDNDITEPEGNDGDIGPAGTGNGDLADAVNFYWWADDGDNVFEQGEHLLPAGPLGNLAVGGTATIALSDSQTNIWGDNLTTTHALPGGQVRNIGKAWCFGDSTFAAYPATDTASAPINTTPIARPVVCSGASKNNITQTDSMTADISFRAIQSRNNSGFVCSTLLGAITLNPDWKPGSYVHEVMQINYARLADGLVDFTLANAGTPSLVYYQFHGPKSAGAGSFEWSYRDQTPAWVGPLGDYEGYNSTLLNPIWASDTTIVPAGTPVLITITLTKTDGSTQTVTTTYTVTAQDVLDADHI
ncbi:MAG: hypothetical protein Q7R89_00540 [bacterium]|nr:hypothetical protein [bacterium]